MILTRSTSAGPRRQLRRIGFACAVGLFFCLATLPAHAHDDSAPAAPPSAAAREAAGRWTIGILSLATGIAVYYVVQRHRLVNSSHRPPEWDRAMGRNAVLFAVVAAVAVGGVCAALSRPAPAAVQAAAPETDQPMVR